MVYNIRTTDQTPQSQRISSNFLKPIEKELGLSPEILDEKMNNPDFLLDLSQSDNQEVDGNLNKLMSLTRLILAKMQKTQRTNEKVKLYQKEDEVQEKIKGSKNITKNESRILFAQGIATLAFAITPTLPELQDNDDLKNLIKGVSDFTQVFSSSLTKGYDANLNEVNNQISLIHQHLQKINNKEPSLLRNVDESFSNMIASMRVN